MWLTIVELPKRWPSRCSRAYHLLLRVTRPFLLLPENFTVAVSHRFSSESTGEEEGTLLLNPLHSVQHVKCSVKAAGALPQTPTFATRRAPYGILSRTLVMNVTKRPPVPFVSLLKIKRSCWNSSRTIRCARRSRSTCELSWFMNSPFV